MNNEENKGINRFQFATEIDRGESKAVEDTKANTEVVGDKPKKKKRRPPTKKPMRKKHQRREDAPRKDAVIEVLDSPSEEVIKPYLEAEAPVQDVVKPFIEPEVIKPYLEEAKQAVEDEIRPYLEKEEENDELALIREKGINLNEAKNIDLDHTLYRDNFFVSNGEAEDEVVEEVKEALELQKTGDEKVEDISRTIRKVYLSFQARVALLIAGIIVLFGSACYIIISTLQSNEIQKINYVEKSNIKYDVCQASNDPYNTTCLKEGVSYPADRSSTIHIDYHYEAEFEKDTNYELSYHVVVVNKIYDAKDSSKISYEDEDLVKEKTVVSNVGNPAVIDVSTEIDYQKYRSFVNNYKQKYSMNADSSLTAILYIDDGNETRNAGEVTIPIVDQSFDIVKKEVTDSKQVYLLNEKNWTNTNTLYIVVGSAFVLLSLFLLFHLTRLALAVTGKKSKYQEYLMSILNEYDRLIVIARDGFETNVEKKVIKVYTFDELLDARSILNKPIVYSRINNVKSEFIVEDEEVIYKFVLKEADMGE